MRTWNENGFEMSEKDGVVMVNDHGLEMIFVKWAELSEGSVVPICWIPTVREGVAE